jgi:CRP-like cAMP-binding protein
MTMTATLPRVPCLSGVQATLRGSSLFRGLTPRHLEGLERASHRRTVERGESLFRAGDEADSITLITVGLVKVVRYLPDTTETILGLFGPRELVGLIAALQGRPYPATAIALSQRVEVLSVRSAAVLEVMRQETALALTINQALIYQAKILHEKIDVMSAGAVPQRLASLLLTLAERFGDEQEGHGTLVPVVLSRGELSSLVGARVETVIRVLSRWQKQGLLETSREGFLLRDIGALAAVQRSKAELD